MNRTQCACETTGVTVYAVLEPRKVGGVDDVVPVVAITLKNSTSFSSVRSKNTVSTRRGSILCG